VLSSTFGPFDPLKPCNVPGLLASIVFAEPIEIEAPHALVWEIMTGFDKYPEWNPINRYFRLDNEAKAGDTVTFGPVWGPYDLSEGASLPEAGFKQNETLSVWEDNACLAYAAISRVLIAERVQYISTLPNGNTRYQTYERMSGIISPIVRLFYASKIVEGFTANGIALKRRAEQFAKESLV
jgi:hypothetical protein